MEITGGDIDEDGPVEICPTYCNVLLAASVISRYINGLDDPIAPKMEVVLPSFTWHHTRLQQTHTLVSTAITDYFPHK